MAKKQAIKILGSGAEEREVEKATQPEGCATETGQEACPTYEIRADTGFGMLGMLALHRLAQDWGGPPDLRREVERVMREFELWEEAHRGDART